MLPSRSISPAYPKSHTCWQHHRALTEGMTRSEPAQTTSVGFPRGQDMSRTLPLAALAMLTLIVAGCSSAPTDTSSGNNAAANHEQAMNVAQCMRDNDVSHVPDPRPSGPLPNQ